MYGHGCADWADLEMGCLQVMFVNELQRDIKQVKLDIKELSAECLEFMKLGEIETVEERVVILGEIEEKLHGVLAKTELYNSREVVRSSNPPSARLHMDCYHSP
jgi:hypothetical protein